MLVQIVSKNNIDNLLMAEASHEPELTLYYMEEEREALLHYRRKLCQKYPWIIKVDSEMYAGLEDLAAAVAALKPKRFQFNDQKVAESLAVVCKLDRKRTEVVFYRSSSGEIHSHQGSAMHREPLEASSLSVGDYVELAGGDIEAVNDRVFDRLIEDGTLDLIVGDRDRWKQFARAFVDATVVSESNSDPLVFTVKFRAVPRRMQKRFRAYIDHFVEKGYFQILAQNINRSILRFTDPASKNFFKLSGSWLELLTYKAVRDLKMDDLDASVLFTWNHRVKNFENEIDLLAVRKGKLLVISCKDTKKVSKEYLNEIVVNSNGLGDDNVIKALVTTSRLLYDSFRVRAKELEIAVIQFTGDFEKMKSEIEDLVK